MKIIDCSYPISKSSPVYPGDPHVDIQYLARFKEDGYELSTVTLTMHTSTHMDAPSHLSNSSKQASDFPVELMVSDACILDVSDQHEISLTNEQITCIQAYEVVFLYTGWSSYYGSEKYFHHPIITYQTAQAIIQAGIKVVVVDMPSVDNTPYAIHHLLLENNVWIIENTMIDEEVLNLRTCKAIITPIKIEAEAALTRVLVMEKTDQIR